MRLLKAILRFKVDIAFFFMMLGLLVWYMINPDKNFTPALWLVCGYVFFNIVNKAQMVIKREDGKL